MKKTVISLLVFICIFLLVQELRCSYLIEWEAVGPAGRNVIGMALNPLNHQEKYALIGDSSASLYKTDSSGQSWIKISSFDGFCYDLSLDPLDPKIIYVLGRSAVFKSVDGGSSWKECRLGDSSFGNRGRIAVNPNNPSIIYASGTHYYSSGRSCMAVFKSSDSGENWTLKTFNSDSKSKRGYMSCLAINPSDSNVVYCGGYFHDDDSTYYYKIYKSSDGGDNWADIAGSISGYPKAIVINQTTPSKIYVGTSQGIFRSSNGGSTWQKNNGEAHSFALAIDDQNSNVLYAGCLNCCYKSVDGGENWTAYSGIICGSCNRLLTSSNQVFYGSNAGVYKSDDGGISWQAYNVGLGAEPVQSFAVASSSPNIIYSVLFGSGLYRSLDFGITWAKIQDNNGFCNSVTKVIVNPYNANDVFIYPGPAG